MMEVVPKAFVEVVFEHSYERDCLYIKCRRSKLQYTLTAEQVLDCEELPPGGAFFSRDSQFLAWFRRNFLSSTYAVRKIK